MNDHLGQTNPLRQAAVRALVDIGLFSVVINVLLLTMPLYLIQVYDRVLPSSSIETLLFLSLIALGALALMGVLETIRSIYAQRVAAVMDQQLASKAFMASASSDRAVLGDIQPLTDLAVLRNFTGSRGLTTLFDLPFVPLFLTVLLFIHATLFWLTLAGAALLALVMVIGQIGTRSASADGPERNAQASLQAQSFVRHVDTLRAMGMTRNAIEFWGEQLATALNQTARGTAFNAGVSGLSRSIRMTLQLAVLGVGAWLVLNGQMTVGMIFTSSIVAGRALQPIDQLIGGWPQIVEARKALSRLKRALASSYVSTTAKTTLPTPTGAIHVKNLIYAPPNSPVGAEPIIKRVSLVIDAGSSLAIIGPSRAGKSTLARLLVGAVQPNSGSVAYDFADLRTWDPEQLGRHVGYLAQDVQLFPGTIAQNVSRFDPDATDEKIIAAAQCAQAHELMSSQRDGYGTQIGASAHALSSGERQRIGLARAFYGEPKILVLDEPNANLDSDGEIALSQALENAKEAGTTVVIVTHRMSVATTCDRVMMMRDGQIEAFGPPSEVFEHLKKHQQSAQAGPISSFKPETFSTGGPGRASIASGGTRYGSAT